MEEQTNNIVEKKTNGFAIAGLVCSILLGGIIGLILSIIGIINSKKCNSGKGMSIAGLIISVLKILLVVGLFFVGLYAIKNTDEGKEYFCESMSTQKESCTLKKDGTYDCIFATCDFDNIKESKEDEEKPGNKDREEEKNKSSNNNNTKQNTPVYNGLYYTDISADTDGITTKSDMWVVVYKSNEKVEKGIKESGGFKIDSNGNLSYESSNDKDIKYEEVYSEIKDKKFVSLLPTGGIGPQYVTALTTDGEVLELFPADDIEYVKDIEIVKKVDLGNHGNITNLAYYVNSSVNDCEVFYTALYEIDGKYYQYSKNKLVAINNDQVTRRVASCLTDGGIDFKLDDLLFTYGNKLLLPNSIYLKDSTSNKEIVVDYALYEYDWSVKTTEENLYLISDEGKLYKMTDVQEQTSPIGDVEKLTINHEMIEIKLKDGKTVTIE